MIFPTQESTTGTVPSASTQQTVNPAELLSNIFAKNQGDLAKASVAAATPIPGGHASQMPLTMQTGPRQTHPGQLDHREVVGAGNARAQGIGNSVIGVMNLIAGTETALDNKKKLEIASSTQQLLTAQQAYDQASQLYKQDPQNADAKAAMERNKGVMNSILSDDKIRKAIAKGMHIDFTDPKANETLEHQAVAQGKQMATQHSDYADQFNKGTPQVMQPNQQAIARYEAMKEQQKSNLESMKAMMPYFTEQLRSGTELQKADVEGAVKLRVAATEAQGKIDAQILKNKQSGIDNAAAMSLERLRGAEARLTASATAGDPRNIMKDFESASDEYLKHLEANQNERTSLNKELDSRISQSRQKEIRSQLQRIDDQDNTARLSFELSRNFAAKQAGVPIETMQVPTVHVGDGLNAGTSRESTKPPATPDIDPFTGKHYPRGTSNVERALKSFIHGGESIVRKLSTDQNPENKSALELLREKLPKPASDRPD
jgi:hypothetical protein